jgi:hypothetical protein
MGKARRESYLETMEVLLWKKLKRTKVSTKIRNDRRTFSKKAKENKKEDLKDLYTKGKNSKARKLDTSKHLLNVTKALGVDLGENELEIKNNLKACSDFDMQRKEKVSH